MDAAVNPSWEQVLAAVEEEARRAEALLASDTPAPLPEAVVLPPLAQMPPIPPELRERIVALRDHIEELQRLLSSAMSSWQDPRRSALVSAAAPRFLDRRI